MKKLITLFLCTQMCLSAIAQTDYSYSNPILNPTAFIPDGEPHIFEYKGEKRLFLYGSRDERIKGYCGYGHDVWSAPINDLSKWTNHGEIFNVKQVQDTGYGIANQQHFGAPDCVYNPLTKKYYLYTFLGAGYKLSDKMIKAGAVQGFEGRGPNCLVAESESPAGPFVNPIMCDWPALNSAGAFDPSVLVDTKSDGSVHVYAFWGMREGDRCAEIDPYDMHTIINSKTRKPDRNAYQKTLPNKENNNGSSLFEASSIKKVSDNKYVFIYSPNERPFALTYCYSNSPMGPWKFGGRIVDNTNGWRGGNNHGSIACINNQWYMFYHRHTSNGINRQAMMQPIDLKIIGDSIAIPTIPLLSEATAGSGLNPFKRYNISVCCHRKGDCSVSGNPREADGLQPLQGIKNGHEVGVRYFNFGSKGIDSTDKINLCLNIQLLQDASLSILCASEKEGQIKEMGHFDLQKYLNADGKYHEIKLPLNLTNVGTIKGRQALYFCFHSKSDKSLCEIKEFELQRDGESTPNPLQEIILENSGSSVKAVAIPSKARIGESVKILYSTENKDMIKSVLITDANGKMIKAFRNAVVPHGPISYHFEMPSTPVKITTKTK